MSKEQELLKFQRGGNAKLDEDVCSFSLPAGWSCPGARDCLTKVDPETGKIIDGQFQKFRCFAAVSETRPNVRNAHWHNFRLLIEARTCEGMTELIRDSLPRKIKKLRVHVSGDFFNAPYFEAWMAIANIFTATQMYAYTKSITIVNDYIGKNKKIPKNFKLTLSYGGQWDAQVEELRSLAQKYNTLMGSSEVVFHPDEADAKGLEIDHDDSHALNAGNPFALLVHSQQPTGSKAAEAIKRMKLEGIQYSYSSKKNGNK